MVCHVLAKHHKLIPANPENLFLVKMPQQDMGNCFEHHIACLMPLMVVQFMEAIGIHVNTGHGRGLCVIKSLHRLFVAVPVLESGQRIH